MNIGKERKGGERQQYKDTKRGGEEEGESRGGGKYKCQIRWISQDFCRATKWETKKG